MMNKKWNILMLVLIGALVLNGCESNNASEKNIVSKEDDTTLPESVEATEEKNAAESNAKEQSKEAQTTKSIPTVTVTSVREEWYTDDQEVLLLESEGNRVSVENEEFDALKNALEERFTGNDEEVYVRLYESAKDHYEVSYMETDEYFPAYSSYESVEIIRCDQDVLSIRVFDSEYTGGAHGFAGYEGVNYDVETGKELSISDIIIDKKGFCETAPTYITDVLDEEYGDELFPEYKEIVNEAFREDGRLNWYLNATGIVVIYNSYDLGPYAMGEVEVVLPYEEFAQFIDAKYINVQGEVIARILADEKSSNLLGEENKISLKTQWTEYDMLNVSIVTGEVEESIGEFGRFYDAYVIKRKDNRCFLIVTCDWMSDDYVTFVYEITNGTVIKCDELGGAAINGGLITADKIELSMRLDVLGTYSAQMDYHLDESGKLTQAEEIFSLGGIGTLTIIKPLPVVLEGEEVLLNVDTKIRLTGTNNVDEVYFEVLETGKTGIVYYEMQDEESWIHMIDGVSEYEYFESLPYAG